MTDDLVSELREAIAAMQPPPKLMTPSECAEFLGLSEEALSAWRKEGKGPPYLHITSRTIRYDRDDVLDWARSHRVNAN